MKTQIPPIAQRLDCLICNYHQPIAATADFVPYASNVRAFMDQTYKLWRCPDCDTIHCLDVVDLDAYYANYPFAAAALKPGINTVLYGKILHQFQQSGMTKDHSFLDYGCANGLFVEFLRQQGFAHCDGYDPYGDKDGYGNPAPLQRGNFDYILLQDVIEHVDDPYELLSKLDHLLAPGGHILIGTPNASQIDLDPRKSPTYKHEIHAPYHLRLYTRSSLEYLGKSQAWEPVQFFARSYSDTHWPGINTRAWTHYSNLFDGSLDCLMEPLTGQRMRRALRSGKFWFYAFFGYWLSYKTYMSVMFRKGDR
jgi:SAM-dependent methyltransferase